MEELHGHTLEYWKNNAEEDYLKVPISVLKYITCLEERIEQLTIPVVVKSLPCGDEIWLKAQETDRFLFEEWFDELK